MVSVMPFMAERLVAMRVKNLLIVVAVASSLAGLFGVAQVQASTFRVDFQMTGNTTMSGVESYAAAANPTAFGNDGTNFWNDWSLACADLVNPSLPNLKDSAGNATSVSLAFTGSKIGGANGALNSSTTALQYDFIFFKTSPVTLTVSGLKADTVTDLYVYSTYPAGTNRGFNISLDGANYTTVSSGSTLGGMSLTGTTNSAGSLTLYFQLPTGITESDIGGLQIHQAVPEPGTFAILACGLLSLIAYAWRKRR
jgi:hypothetical protein